MRSYSAQDDLIAALREENERLRDALRHLHEFGVRLMNGQSEDERGIGCCVAEGSRMVVESRTEE